jgi:hypothetical protein
LREQERRARNLLVLGILALPIEKRFLRERDFVDDVGVDGVCAGMRSCIGEGVVDAEVAEL